MAAALAHARERRLCLSAKTKSGVRLLERRVESGELISPFPHLFEEKGYWRSLGLPEKALRVIRGAAVLHPDWVFCDTSAALAYGLEVSQPKPGLVHIVTSPKAHSASTPHIVRHSMSDPSVRMASGVHVVDVETCVLGCIATLDLPHGLAVADSYLPERDLERLDLIGLCEETIAYRQRRSAALRCARSADPLAENGGESMARGTMIELGYRVPELQVEIADPLDTARSFRVDFMWDGPDCERAIIGELDGMCKYEDEGMLQGRGALRALSDERLRESRLTVSGARVMRFRFEDVLDRRGFSRLLDTFGVPREQDSRPPARQ